MRLKKRNKTAKDREVFKKQRIDTTACLSDGSCYAPSESEADTESAGEAQKPAKIGAYSSSKACDTLKALLQDETSGSSKSDGEILLDMDELFDENDWDPHLHPNFYPIFTEPVKSFKEAEKAKCTPIYTGKSRTSVWWRKVSEAKQAKEAASCANIRNFLTAKNLGKNSPCTEYVDEQCEGEVDVLPNEHETGQVGAQGPVLGPHDAMFQSTPWLGLELHLPSPSVCTDSSPKSADALQDRPRLGVEDMLAGLRFASPSEPALLTEVGPKEGFGESLNGPDSSVKIQLEDLHNKLAKMQAHVEKDMKARKGKIDPRDVADIQVLMDYCTLAKQLCCEGCQNPEVTASLQIARMKISTVSKDGDIVSKGAWYACTLRSKAKHVRECNELPECQQGKGGVHNSLLDNSAVISAVKNFIDRLGVGKISPGLLMREVNMKILPSLSLSKSSITENTAKRWMLQLGFKHDTYCKGIYMDGHEQEDVVAYRKGFLDKGEALLCQKGCGHLVRVLDIIVEGTGRLVLSEQEVEMQKALPENQRIKDMLQLIAQIKDAIKIFEFKYLGAQMLLFVDQSSSHNAYANDALNARKMNVNPSGKQPIMHNTAIPDNNPNPLLRGQPQLMVFDVTHPEYPNKPKGMEQVLKERGLWDLLTKAAGGKRPVGCCKTCKASAAERERILREAQTTIDDNPDAFGSIGHAEGVT
ncbi:hypothetical protein CTheo_6045 [Ceratobasidium theobromae]|uniref:Uncharacterized protein n=1 Tax=Ceratobasidium theobromae TaxID=1582974 RepID=A0A5N5QGD7_9AGAM|nr:hypothetical protein CTheo_6045 [Ceratobasidium theobromae]